jgi:hypothetical protein
MAEKSGFEKLLYSFFEPFFKTKTGQIIGLATRLESMRDGLAMTLLARFFGLPEHHGIKVEPGRRTLPPLARNVILVGWTWLFLHPGRTSGRDAPARPGRAKLSRIEELHSRCCLRIEEDKAGVRRVINGLTKRTYEPRRAGADGEPEVDYGVIRRWFPSVSSNMITLEGLHRLGTLGATIVATSEQDLERIHSAIQSLDDYDKKLPLEILVEAEFFPDTDEIYSFASVTAKPLVLIYNSQFVYDMADEERGWQDQRPLDIHVAAIGSAAARPFPQGPRDPKVPRFELLIELGNRSVADRNLCREVLSDEALSPGAKRSEKRVTQLIDLLVDLSDDFKLELWDPPLQGQTARPISLPKGRLTDLLKTRKRFLIHLVLCRLMGRPLPCTEGLIRQTYGGFQRKLRGKTDEDRAEDLVRKFIGAVPGKLREGFKPLLEENKNYLRTVCSKTPQAQRTYTLKLERVMIVLKIRF